MAPIRIGILGLSASGGWASAAHYPYLKQTSKYKIVALCNSSAESARAAIKHFELPSDTKAYGSPEELAKDQQIDLIVCTVRVDRHYATLKPALMAGKTNIYCEWPLGANLAEAQELAELATKGGVRTMVGLQARQAPIINKVKELVDNGRIGRVLSCSVMCSAGNFGPTESQRTKYFNDRSVGGNMLTIHFAHMLDYVLYATGELASFTGLLSTQRPKIDILDKDGNQVETVTRDSFDQIMLQGHLKNGGVLNVHERGGNPFKDESGLLWRIYGERGEIMVKSDGSFLQIGYPNMSITVHDHGSDKLDHVEFSWPTIDGLDLNELPFPARNVALLYEAFAAGKTQDYVQMDESVARHKILHLLQKEAGVPE